MKGVLATSRICLLLIGGLVSALLPGCSEQQPAKTQPEAQPEQQSAAQPAAVSGSLAATKDAYTEPGAVVTTEKGAYKVRLQPKNPPVRIGERQPWIAQVTDAHGADFVPNALYFDGGMPGHGHGLPSAPEFTRHLGGSDYLLEGLALNMPGNWRFVVTVGGPSGVDSAVFDFDIKPGSLTWGTSNNTSGDWSDNELALISSLRLSALTQPADPSNRLLNNSAAIALGRDLFNEVGLSATGAVSCATCHDSDRGFADGKPLGFGSAETKRHTPTLGFTGMAAAIASGRKR